MNLMMRSSFSFPKFVFLFSVALLVLVDKNVNAEWVTTTTTTTTETTTVAEYEDAPPRHEEGPQGFERGTNDYHGSFRGSSSSINTNNYNGNNYIQANEKEDVFVYPADCVVKGDYCDDSACCSGLTCATKAGRRGYLYVCE